LIDFADKEYFKISGGNRKKLSLACAFLGDNDVILLDEPTMGIDYAVKRDI
jgi:ABC-2 type transport system ATP-binding protein